MRDKLFSDYVLFATAQLKSKDIDPVYPVLKASYEFSRPDNPFWFTFLYLVYYNLNSAQAVWRLFPEQTVAVLPVLPTGVERRGFRGNQIVKTEATLQALAAVAPRGVDRWVLSLLDSSPQSSWRRIRAALESLPHCGVWASYKWADLIKNVHGLPISADNIGDTPSPLYGMSRLTGLSEKESRFNVNAQQQLLTKSIQAGVPFEGLEEMETTLCDFKSLLDGNYYAGHDIDMMQQTLEADSPFFGARAKSIPNDWLGEMNGWQGVRKELKSLYRNTGKVYTG